MRLLGLTTGIATLTACVGGRPVESTFPCVQDQVEVWRVKTSKAGSLRVVVDTVSESSTFDPAVELWTVSEWDNTAAGVVFDRYLDGSDDEFGCAFPPPDFECPQLISSVSESDQDFAVVVIVVGECVDADASYELVVERDGKEQKLKSVGLGDYSELDFPSNSAP